jgi:diguanylate cyclase (GGDEF)-like protein
VHETPDTVERLREALIDLERGRRRERELRAVEATMLDILRVLALAEHRHETFAALLEVLRGPLDFEDAAIFATGGAGAFTAVRGTAAWLAAVQFMPGRMLRRVSAGETVATFDAGAVPEWCAQPPDVRARVRSALHAPLRAGDGAVLLVCTHSQRARFEHRHVELLKRLAPLAGQILHKLDLRDALAVREQERQERLAMFNAVVSQMQAGVLVEDEQRRVFALNDALRDILRIDAPVEDLIGTDAAALGAGLGPLAGTDDSLAARLGAIVGERAVVGAESLALADGRIIERDYVPVSAPNGRFVAHLWQYRDVTIQHAAAESLRRQALQDALTGLPNRAHFINEVNLALREQRGCPDRCAAVLFLDLDRFKVVNDRVGHTVADRLLVAFADRLRGIVRATDKVARHGGDEFTILVTGMEQPSEAQRVAQCIRECLSAPLTFAGEDFVVTTSIGIAACTARYASAEDVLRDADLAMYRAKAAGGDCFQVFDSVMQAESSERLMLEQDLRHCLDRHQLRVHYQPIVELATGRLRGFEALVRWQHPTLGLILPDRFIPIAEETGQITAIDGWVLETAATQLVAWRERLPRATELRMAANVSRRNLMRGAFPRVLAQIIEQTRVPARQLDIEITETTVIDDFALACETLKDLRELGVRVAIDDFGTGHSSLSVLARLAPQVIKMDRTFLADLETNRAGREIVRAVLALAVRVGIEIVAEGVETISQQRILAEEGCAVCQGYLFSPPVDAGAAARFIAEDAPDGWAAAERVAPRAAVESSRSEL